MLGVSLEIDLGSVCLMPVGPDLGVFDYDEHLVGRIEVGEALPAGRHGIALGSEFGPFSPVGIIGPKRVGLEFHQEALPADRVVIHG